MFLNYLLNGFTRSPSGSAGHRHHQDHLLLSSHDNEHASDLSTRIHNFRDESIISSLALNFRFYFPIFILIISCLSSSSSSSSTNHHHHLSRIGLLWYFATSEQHRCTEVKSIRFKPDHHPFLQKVRHLSTTTWPPTPEHVPPFPCGCRSESATWTRKQATRTTTS